MEKFKFIEVVEENEMATVWLNRPEVRNAFHEGLIAEITQVFEYLALTSYRLVVLRGKGLSFCAGADLNWMKNVAQYSFEENLKESNALSKCFATIYEHPNPTLALVHGAAIGGANGLLAACDWAYAEESTVFSLSEVKIGIVPACISPFVIKRVGEFNARDLMISGKRILASEALQRQLINGVTPGGGLDIVQNDLLENLKGSGPEAIRMVKKLIFNVCNVWNLEEAKKQTAEMIATMRGTSEAQEGMKAFLEKRKPSWNN